MSKAVREPFEAALLLRLQGLADELPAARAFKNQLKFYDGRQAVGRLSFVHLAKADAYYVIASVSGGEVHEFCKAHAPPYRSNLLNPDMTLLHSSLSDRDRRFADEAGGAVRVWKADGIERICERMLEKIRAFHLPRICHALTAAPELVQDVLGGPDDYAYPALAIAAVRRERSLEWEPGFADELLRNRKVVKDRAFDSRMLGIG